MSQTLAEDTLKPAQIDLDARGLELTKQKKAIDDEIAELQKKRAPINAELRSVTTKIATRNMQAAASATADLVTDASKED